jgi:glycosyltransferase involved in cell wall biosynthesis
MQSTPKISVITPSFRSSEWLKLCIASVADQGIQHEHIIQDSCSHDGTQEWLPNDPRVVAFVEKDEGMYDAINRGLRRASGDILCYLNCDEQYLPGALRKVQTYFEEHPETEVLFANAIVVDMEGRFICYRKAIIPQLYQTLTGNTLSVLTCATFFRRRIVERGLFFNRDFRVLGDVEWVTRLIRERFQMAVLPEFTSTFTATGSNLSNHPRAVAERRQLIVSVPYWVQLLRPAFTLHYRLRRLRYKAYYQRPFEYSIYTRMSPDNRRICFVQSPTFRWRWDTCRLVDMTNSKS